MHAHPKSIPDYISNEGIFAHTYAPELHNPAPDFRPNITSPNLVGCTILQYKRPFSEQTHQQMYSHLQRLTRWSVAVVELIHKLQNVKAYIPTSPALVYRRAYQTPFPEVE